MSKDGININSAPNNFTRPLKPPGTPKEIKSVSNWIKPSTLPKKFHKEVWLTKRYFHDSEPCTPFIVTVQNHYRGNIPEMWNGESWEYVSDEMCRIMMLDKPGSASAFGETV